MKRHAFGVIAATLAAPYIGAVIFCAFIEGKLILEGKPITFLSVRDGIINLENITWEIYFLGTFGLLKYGITIFIVSLAAALIMGGRAVKAPAFVISAYTFIGFCFGSHILASFAQTPWWLLPSFMITGAICGWIYWRIATGRPA